MRLQLSHLLNRRNLLLNWLLRVAPRDGPPVPLLHLLLRHSLPVSRWLKLLRNELLKLLCGRCGILTYYLRSPRLLNG